MSYLTTTYYSGNGCTTVQTAAVVAVPNCEAIAVAPSYRNCTVDTANSNPLLQRETKIDCVTAASPAAAFRQVAPSLDVRV